MPKETNEKSCGALGIRPSVSGRDADRGVDLIGRVRGQRDRPANRLAERRSTLCRSSQGAFGAWFREIKDGHAEFAKTRDVASGWRGSTDAVPEVRHFFDLTQTWLIGDIHNVCSDFAVGGVSHAFAPPENLPLSEHVSRFITTELERVPCPCQDERVR